MKSIIFSALITTASFAVASPEISFVCNVNKSESFVIYPTEEKVIHSIFLQSKVELNLTSFNTYRCPGCYSFEGTAEGKTYTAKIQGLITENGIEQTLSYKVDGVQQPDILCFTPKN